MLVHLSGCHVCIKGRLLCWGELPSRLACGSGAVMGWAVTRKSLYAGLASLHQQSLSWCRSLTVCNHCSSNLNSGLLFLKERVSNGRRFFRYLICIPSEGFFSHRLFYFILFKQRMDILWSLIMVTACWTIGPAPRLPLQNCYKIFLFICRRQEAQIQYNADLFKYNESWK